MSNRASARPAVLRASTNQELHDGVLDALYALRVERPTKRGLWPLSPKELRAAVAVLECAQHDGQLLDPTVPYLMPQERPLALLSSRKAQQTNPDGSVTTPAGYCPKAFRKELAELEAQDVLSQVEQANRDGLSARAGKVKKVGFDVDPIAAPVPAWPHARELARAGLEERLAPSAFAFITRAGYLADEDGCLPPMSETDIERHFGLTRRTVADGLKSKFRLDARAGLADGRWVQGPDGRKRLVIRVCRPGDPIAEPLTVEAEPLPVERRAPTAAAPAQAPQDELDRDLFELMGSVAPQRQAEPVGGEVPVPKGGKLTVSVPGFGEVTDTPARLALFMFDWVRDAAYARVVLDDEQQARHYLAVATGMCADGLDVCRGERGVGKREIAAAFEEQVAGLRFERLQHQ